MSKTRVLLASALLFFFLFLFSNITIQSSFAQECTSWFQTSSSLQSCSNALFSQNCTGQGSFTGTQCCQSTQVAGGSGPYDYCQNRPRAGSGVEIPLQEFRCCFNAPTPTNTPTPTLTPTPTPTPTITPTPPPPCNGTCQYSCNPGDTTVGGTVCGFSFQLCCLAPTPTPTLAPTTCPGCGPTNTPTPTPILHSIYGNVYYDNNKNGVYDGNPPDSWYDGTLPGSFARVMTTGDLPNGTYYMNSNGYYGSDPIYVPSRNYTVTLENIPPNCYTSTQNGQTYVMPNANLVINFPLVCNGPTPTNTPIPTNTPTPTPTPTPIPCQVTTTPNVYNLAPGASKGTPI